MQDYKKIIKYLEKATGLLEGNTGDNVDLLHAYANLQFALMDLREIDYEQDKEIASMGEDYMRGFMGIDLDESFDKLTIRGKNDKK